MTATADAPTYDPPALDDAVLEHLEGTPTIGLRDLAKAIGVSRTTAHKSVRRLVSAGRLNIVRVGTCAEEPSTYTVG